MRDKVTHFVEINVGDNRFYLLYFFSEVSAISAFNMISSKIDKIGGVTMPSEYGDWSLEHGRFAIRADAIRAVSMLRMKHADHIWQD